jgi:hypothetical protein
MKKVLAIAVALTMTVAVGTASAHHGGGDNGKRFGHHHGRHHHHHGFIVAGTNASFTGSKNADGTYTGDLTLTLKHHGDKAAAHKSNGTGDDTGTTKTFHLNGTAVKFSDSVTDANGDGTVDFSDVQPTDVVVLKVFGGHHRFRSHGAKAHKSCHNGDQNSGTSDNSSTPTVKKAFVFRPQQQEAEPAPQPQG